MKRNLLFLTLNTFSATGGIEQVCRVAGKALSEIAAEMDEDLQVFALHDRDGHADERYFPATSFKAFGGSRAAFTSASIRKGIRSRVVLLSHINLLPIGFLIKKLSPNTRLVLLAHGIEVWEDLSGLKKKILGAVDLFLPVSSFTGNKLQTLHGVADGRIRVLNNCLDPFLVSERNPALVDELRKRYGLKNEDKVLLTVTRLKFSEQYKGYDRVINALRSIHESNINVRYLIVGKYDQEEKQRLDALIALNGLEDAVIFSGYVDDEELRAHFHLGDVYIMPSTGEGFGIVFIEALFYGLPVIAGNIDGSVDALAGGKFGLLINPQNHNEISKAVNRVFQDQQRFKSEPDDLNRVFGFETYKSKLQSLLAS